MSVWPHALSVGRTVRLQFPMARPPVWPLCSALSSSTPTFFFFLFILPVVWKHLQRPGADGRLGLLRRVQQDLGGGAVCGGGAGTESASSFVCQRATGLFARRDLMISLSYAN